MISYETLKGYLLEEILAHLIRNTGYKLLVDPSQDPRELARRRNGLVVQGRGGVHQVDVLGQLLWIPAFTFPIRLFVEAKYRKARTGLPEIRNAVGVVEDINQNFSPIREGSNRLMKRYSYQYALFSASGFSKNAVDYALAHQLSLIDLSGPDFDDLLKFVDDLAELIFTQPHPGYKTSKFFELLRSSIRRQLATWPSNIQFPAEVNNDLENMYSEFTEFWNEFSTAMQEGIEKIGELFVGMAEGPFLLIFRPRDENEFLSFAELNASHRVSISWTDQEDLRTQWTIQPIENPNAYELSFGLPQALADWIFDDSTTSRVSAQQAKQQFFSDITIYRHVDDKDFLYRLRYDAEATRKLLRQRS